MKRGRAPVWAYMLVPVGVVACVAAFALESESMPLGWLFAIGCALVMLGWLRIERY